ncbi:hypothetical protein [Priestia megaterium]|uniref:hypothetical protein n=1 Tax=Priestia megaterium TaxID=1404 RepID=UPI001FB424F6|nr:hypothetical protein [Priestia megaterium]
MKKVVGITLLSCGLLLAGCGNETSKETSTNQAQEDVKNEAVKKKEESTGTTEQEEIAMNEDAEGAANQPTKEEKKEGWRFKEGFGLVKEYGFGYNDEAGIDGTDDPTKPIQFGPVNLYIDNMTVTDIKPNEDIKSMFNDQDEVRGVVVTMRVENTADQDITFDPNQSILVTDSGEQIESEMMMMGDAGGDFMGKVKKEGQTWWLIKDNTKDIKNIKMIISPPYYTDSMDDIGTEKRLDFEILDPKAAKKRDKQ